MRYIFKRAMSVTLTLCLLLTLIPAFSPPAFAATADLTLDFGYSKSTIAPGEEVTITVSLANYNDPGIFPMESIAVEMLVDTDILEYVDGSASDLASAGSPGILGRNSLKSITLFYYEINRRCFGRNILYP